MTKSTHFRPASDVHLLGRAARKRAVIMLRRLVTLTLLAVLPCSAFFAPAAIGGAALGATWHTRCLLGGARKPQYGVLALSCASVAPRRPPPPPPKKAAVGAGGASHEKIKDPQLQAGAWREELGLGERRPTCPACLRSPAFAVFVFCRNGGWQCRRSCGYGSYRKLCGCRAAPLVTGLDKNWTTSYCQGSIVCRPR